MPPMPNFTRYIGIDYSGAETAESSCKGIRVYMAEGLNEPTQVLAPPSPRLYWTRRGLAKWLSDKLADDIPTIVGIDHGFFLPYRVFRQIWPSPRLAELPARFPKALADRRTRQFYRPHSGRRRWRRLEADGREQLAPPDRTVDGHRQISFLVRRSRLGRQVYIRRSALAALLAKLVQAANPLLAVRRLGDSSGQIGRRRGLSGSVECDGSKEKVATEMNMPPSPPQLGYNVLTGTEYLPATLIRR